MKRRTVISLVALALLAIVPTAAASAAPVRHAVGRIGPAAAWGSPPVAGGVHPDSWYGTVCTGEFVEPQFSYPTFHWGGVQSCSSVEPQTLEFLLLNSHGDVVGSPYKAWVGNQGYIHETAHCSSGAPGLWQEYAYGTANDRQLQPYPAVKRFDIDCYIPGTSDGGCHQMAIKAALMRRGLDSTAEHIRDVKPDC